MPLFSLIVPTRGRVAGLRRLLESLRDHAEDPASIEVIVVVDEDDRESQSFSFPELRLERVVVPPGQTMGDLTLAGYRAASGRYLMLLNDDVVVRTPNWDVRLRQVFERHPDGIVLVHVNELIFRDSLCTFPALTREFCQIAGGISRAEYRRYRIDDHIHHIFDLIYLLGYTRRVFLPDVVFEHHNTVEHATGPAAYVPNPAIHELDTVDFEALTEERRRVALACVERIESRSCPEVRAARARLLESFPDAIAIRQREHARQWPPSAGSAHSGVAIAVIAESPQLARDCLESIEQACGGLPVVVMPRRNDALASCRSAYLALLEPAVRVSPSWVQNALLALSTGAGIAVSEGALFIDMPLCGHLRFDEPHESVGDYLTRARAAGIRDSEWIGGSGLECSLPAGSPEPAMAPTVVALPPLHIRLGFQLWNLLALFAVRWRVLDGTGLGIPAGLFDAGWYRAQYPEVEASATPPLLHFLRRGGFEGCDPNAHFDSSWYLANYPDVAAGGLNPLLHFVRYGAREGRNPNRWFDTHYYVRRNPDVLPNRINPLAHFLRYGMRQGKSPNPGISLAHYLRQIGPQSPAIQVAVSRPASISVVIPTRNRVDLLARTLDACQCYSAVCDLEIVVIDDGSTDGTPEFLRRLARTYPALRWQTQPAGGPARARNLGAALARHDVILFMGDDIVPSNFGFFRTHALRHAENPETNFAVLGKVEWPRYQFPITFTMAHMVADGAQFAFSRLEPGSIAGWQFFYTSNVSVKRSLVRDWGSRGFDTSFPAAALEDVELAYRLSQSDTGTRIYYDPSSVGLHYHPYTLDEFLDRQVRVGRSLRRMLELHPELMDEYGIGRVVEALRQPRPPGKGAAGSSIDEVKAFARGLEAEGKLGSESWHGEFLSALFELCMHDGYATAGIDEAANVPAARAAVVQRFLRRVPMNLAGK